MKKKYFIYLILLIFFIPLSNIYASTDSVYLNSSNNEFLMNNTSINVISEFPIEQRANMYIDSPNITSVFGEKLLIEGWLMSTVSNGKIRLYIDSQEVQFEVERKERPDVLKAITGYGDETINPTPGFLITSSLDNFGNGMHEVKVVYTNENGVKMIQQTFSIIINKNVGSMYIDYPTSSSLYGDNLMIEGWLMSTSTNGDFHLYIDNQEVTFDIERKDRLDVIKAVTKYGNEKVNPTPGFLITTSLSKFQDGLHNVRVVYTNKEDIEITQKSFSIMINRTVGSMYIDYPTSSSLYGDNLVIEGWLMSTNPNGDFHLYVDNQEVSFDIERKERLDVIKAVTKYGNEKVNPTPGFLITTSLSSFQDGIHSVKLVYTSKERIEITQQNFLIMINRTVGSMYIDYPTSSSLYGDNLVIEGWLMSTNPNGDFRLYIDNQELSFGIERKERADVIKAVTKYGDETINPTPGFLITTSLSSFQDGMHSVKVVYTNKDNIEVAQQNFLITIDTTVAKMCLDSPNVVNISGEVDISGWIMTPVQNYQLKMYIDNQLVDVEFNRINRLDVIKAISGYGDERLNQKPGFSTILDLSSYYDGEHYIEVVAVSSDDVVLSKVGKKVNLTKFSTKTYLDEPINHYQLNGTELKIGGWILTDCPDYQIQLWIDNQYVKDITNKKERPDVIKAFGNLFKSTSANETPGYEEIIDLSTYRDGQHKLEIKVVQTKIDEILAMDSSEIFLKRYENDMELEMEQDIMGSSLSVSGWYLTNAKSTTLKFYIDNHEVSINNFKRVKREDISNQITDKYNLENQNKQPGFIGDIDLSNYLDGNHTLKVEAINQVTDEVLSYVIHDFKLVKYIGNMYLDTPDMNVSGINIEISGWSLTTSPASTLKFYIDGKEINIVNFSRKIREDVIEAYKYKYDADKLQDLPGFEGILDVSSYLDGKHVIVAKLINLATEEIIASASKEFYLKKYDGHLELEYPQKSNFSSDSNLYIQGWELSESNSSKVKIYFDQEELEVNRGERTDVIDAYPDSYGGSSVNVNPGYSASYDLKSVSSGEHTIKIELYSTDNDKIAMITRKVIVYSNIYFGIDVSSHQGNINWSEVKKSGIDFAILRLGYGDNFSSQDDRTFINNVNGCVENNIPYGVYLYSYALSKNGTDSLNVDSESIDSEIAHTLRILNSLNINQKSSLKLPVFLDMEDSSTVGLGKEILTGMADYYCTNIQSNGYTCGIYANKNWFNNYLDGSYLGSKYEIWLAHYTDDYSNFSDYNGIYQVWQYTSGGSLGGISSSGLDMDISFKKYW